jgi:hypothetical protein
MAGNKQRNLTTSPDNRSYRAIAFRVMQESRPNSGRPVALHSAMLELWFEEICDLCSAKSPYVQEKVQLSQTTLT